MRVKSVISMQLLPILAMLLIGCNPSFEINNEPEEIRLLLCVLNPEDSVQYIRLARGFQIEGDAQLYAAENDLSVSGAAISMTGTNGTQYTATPVAGLVKDSLGDFFPGQMVYKIITDGSGPGKELLEPGTRYRLEVGTPDAETFMYAETTIPWLPIFIGNLEIQDGAGALKCLPEFDLRYPLAVSWRPGNSQSFEIRVKLRYEINGIPDSITWGPTDLVIENDGCFEGNDRMCYNFSGRELLNYYKARMPQGWVDYTYDMEDSCVINPWNEPEINAEMPRSFEFEVSGLDSHLTRYMFSTDQGSLELTAAREPYTNVRSQMRTVGVFGSYSIDRKWAQMAWCSEYLLALNFRPAPPDCR